MWSILIDLGEDNLIFSFLIYSNKKHKDRFNFVTLFICFYYTLIVIIYSPILIQSNSLISNDIKNTFQARTEFTQWSGIFS